MLKIFMTLILLLTSSFLGAKEILCLPDSVRAPFNEVILTSLKGNRYVIKVRKRGQVILTDKVSYVFLRRGRMARFRNKKQDIEIKSLKLMVNTSVRSSIKITSLNATAYLGHCKLYSDN